MNNEIKLKLFDSKFEGADSNFNWFSHGLLAVGHDALYGAVSFIHFKNIYQTLTLCQALLWELSIEW